MRTRSRWTSTVRVVAAVAAGLRDFSTELEQIADQVLGPSQWEPGIRFPDIIGPASDWFLDHFQRQFGQMPDYIAAGSFATGLVLTECIRRASSLGMRSCETQPLTWIAIRFTGDFVSTLAVECRRTTARCSSAGMVVKK